MAALGQRSNLRPLRSVVQRTRPVIDRRRALRTAAKLVEVLEHAKPKARKLNLKMQSSSSLKLPMEEDIAPVEAVSSQSYSRRRDVRADAEGISSPRPVPKAKHLSPGEAVRGMYAAFNNRNASAAADYLTEDCLYEDLLLGPATICRGRQAFENALNLHPAFVLDRVYEKLQKDFPALNFKPPRLKLIVDSVAEGQNSVGVEWHVELGDKKPFPMGRGLTQAHMCPKTGKIVRVVDIAEAPWRVVGLLTAPLISIFIRFVQNNAFVKAPNYIPPEIMPSQTEPEKNVAATVSDNE